MSDPQNSASEPPPEDDWGDAIQLVRDDAGGSSVLPKRREPVRKTEVIAIDPEAQEVEGEAREPEHTQTDSGDPQGDSQGDPQGDAADGIRITRDIEVHEIAGGKVKRLMPEKADVEKVERVEVAFEEAATERWEVEEKEWTRIETYPLKWLVGITAGVVLMVVGGLALLPKLNQRQLAASGVELRGNGDQADSAGDALAENLMMRHDEARKLYANYVSANVIEEILPLLRNPKEVEPLIRQAGFGALAPRRWEVGEQASWTLYMLHKRPFVTLESELPDFKRLKMFFVLEDEHLLIDWKATVGYCSAPYEELINGEGNAEEIRGSIQPSVFYTMSFPEGEFLSFQLFSPDEQHMLWCYAATDSPQAERLKRLVLGGSILPHAQQSADVTLKLTRGVETSLKNQWLIEEVVHEEWVSP